MASYPVKNICPQKLDLDIDNGIVKNVVFHGGCSGSLQAIAKLVEGLPVEDVISKLSGIRCGNKNTSCPDQLAQTLKNLK